jgi:histidine triad (HIT) family protein
VLVDTAEVSDCVFCEIAGGSLPAHVVVDETDLVAFLDARPVFEGHVLVIPRIHRADLLDCPPEELGRLLAAAQRVVAAVQEGLGAGGAWVSINHRVSQSVPHLHVHVVPRTKGDGLRGFFWPRTKYASEEAAAAVAGRIRRALG